MIKLFTTKKGQIILKNPSIFVFALISVFQFSLGMVGCASSTKEHHQAEYAKLSETRTFENSLTQVWKALESTFRNHKVIDRSPREVSDVEMKRLTQRSLETDWVYGQSRNRYVNYKVNGAVRRKELQMRHKFKVIAETVIGGVKVSVQMSEEVELLKEDGTPAGYEKQDLVDTARVNDLLNQVQNQLLSAAP